MPATHSNFGFSITCKLVQLFVRTHCAEVCKTCRHFSFVFRGRNQRLSLRSRLNPSESRGWDVPGVVKNSDNLVQTRTADTSYAAILQIEWSFEPPALGRFGETDNRSNELV